MESHCCFSISSSRSCSIACRSSRDKLPKPKDVFIFIPSVLFIRNEEKGKKLCASSFFSGTSTPDTSNVILFDIFCYHAVRVIHGNECRDGAPYTLQPLVRDIPFVALVEFRNNLALHHREQVLCVLCVLNFV